MAHKTGRSSENRATYVGKYTPDSYYGKPCTESYRKPPMTTVRLSGGKSARVVKSPPRGSSSY